MLYALKNIGEYFSEYNPEKLEQKFREEFLTDPFEGNVVLCIIDLDKSNESKHEFKSYKYSEIRNKILYKKSSGANACNYTLTFETSLKNLSDKNKLEKDINRLILRWIKNYESKINNKDAKEMLIYIKEKVYKIFEDLKEYAKDFKPKERFLFSFAYKKDGKEYYTCDYFNLEELEKEIKNKFKGKNKDAKGKCILCGQKNIELYGHVLQEIGLQFFTVNQKGFAPGIDEKSAYKKIPICWECAKKIALGKIWIDKYCKYKFRGNIYYYIISEVLSPNKKILKSIYSTFEKRYSQNRALLKEDKLLNVLEELKENGYLNMFKLTIILFELENKRFLILSYNEGISPEYLHKLGKNAESIYEELYSKKHNYNWWVTLISRIFSESPQRLAKHISYIISKKPLNKKQYIPILFKYITTTKKYNGNSSSKLSNEEILKKLKAKDTFAFLQLVDWVKTYDIR